MVPKVQGLILRTGHPNIPEFFQWLSHNRVSAINFSPLIEKFGEPKYTGANLATFGVERQANMHEGLERRSKSFQNSPL